MDIKKERELHKEWYENQFPTLYELYLSGVDEAIGCFRSSEETWLAAKQQAVPDGFVVVPVEPTKNIVDKLEDIASCQPSYGGDDIYKVAIGVLDYDWKSGLKAMIQEAQR